MIKTKKDLVEFLKYEKSKYFTKKTNFIKRIIYKNVDEKSVIWKYQKYLRKVEYYLNNKKKIRYLIFNLKLLKIGNKYGLHISPNTFDKGLKIMHLGSVVANGNARIGKDCSIHINTAIAAGGRTNKAPILGDNCIIGIGATIIGDIKIGDNCAIGAGAVVNKNFEDGNCTIAGVPAKIVSLNTSADWRR